MDALPAACWLPPRCRVSSVDPARPSLAPCSCDLTSALYDVWLPWVVAGSLALGLCMLASIRVVQATMRPVGRADVPLPATADGKSPEVADAVLGAAVEAAEAKAVP